MKGNMLVIKYTINTNHNNNNSDDDDGNFWQFFAYFADLGGIRCPPM